MWVERTERHTAKAYWSISSRKYGRDTGCLTKVSRCFPQSLQEDAGLIPQLGNGRLLSDPSTSFFTIAQSSDCTVWWQSFALLSAFNQTHWFTEKCLQQLCFYSDILQFTQGNETLLPDWQKESWQTFEETSGYVRSERVNKWPNCMTWWWWWWWWCKLEQILFGRILICQSRHNKFILCFVFVTFRVQISGDRLFWPKVSRVGRCRVRILDYVMISPFKSNRPDALLFH